MEYAHRRNLVHRDVKPENILLHGQTTGWQAKLGDFGLAKCLDKAGFSGMTATGAHGGTYHFMPREQLTDFKYVKPVSDVWSLGSTFYTMLTGQLPRDSSPDQDPMNIVLCGKPVPILERDSRIPKDLAKVVDRALLTDPRKRYPTAKEFREALKKAL
jgi:serine/threonine protein kinase